MLSYQDRLNILRETKIRHTLEKRKQNGYSDQDDYGTVPLPEGYSVEPWYNSENDSFYGYDGMCENFCRVLAAHPPSVDPLEMLCGRWRDMLVNYRGDLHYMPEWLKDNPKLQELAKKATNQWSRRWNESRFPYDDLKPDQELYNITTGIDSDSHFACDYSIGFELGFGGLLEKVRKYRGINGDPLGFYAAEERVLLAIVDFVERHINEIERRIQSESRPEIRENLEKMLKVNNNIKLAAPKTFHEACQWAAYFNCVSRIYTRDGAGFQLDGLLYPYYKSDVQNGILDDETAKFIIANLLLIDPHYYQISGVDENDHDITNHLSYLILDAADNINISANLTVRIHENCDNGFLKRAVYLLFKNKNAWPRFCNDKALAEGYMRNGIDKITARKRIAVGCNWMAVPGREFPMNDVVKVNVAKVFEVAWIELDKKDSPSTEKLFELFVNHLKKAVDITAAGINLHLDHAWEVTPELVMNLLMYNTIEKGQDASQCAELFTIGVDGAGLAIVADSFAALEQRIERENRLTWLEMENNLKTNFDGNDGERTRRMLQLSERFCQGNSLGDKWAARITQIWVNLVKTQPMPQGRQLVPGWFSWARSIEYGSKVGATPNGRKAHEPISHGANPNPGFRKDGAATAQSSGIAAVQCGYGNTAPLQLEFDPRITIEEGGVEVVTNLILSHFELGGTLININVLDEEKLLAAHKNTDLYPDLVVRVTGFTAYFASLSPEFRQLVVDRFLRSA